MRVVHIPFGFYPDPVGGTEIYVAALARGQQRRGAEVVIAAPGDRDASYEHAGLPVRRFPVSPTVRNLRELYGAGDAPAAVAFGTMLDELQPDIVHLHAFTRAVSLLTLREAKRRAIPVVFTYHTPTVSCMRGTLLRWGREVCDGTLDRRACTACTLQSHGLPQQASQLVGRVPVAVGTALGNRGRSGGVWTALRMSELVKLRHAALRALLAEADALVALCSWTRALLVRNGVPAAKITCSPHGIAELPAAPPSQHGAARGALRVAFLGRLDPAKGIDLIIAAMRALPGAAITLDIYGVAQAGSDKYAEQLRRAAAADKRITFLSPVSSEHVGTLLASYDLLAVPSRVLETGPLVVLEAFAAGLPVLGAALGGIAELVTDGRDGLLFAPNSVAALRQALTRLIADPALLPRLRVGVRPPRCMEHVVDEMLGLYAALQAPQARSGSELARASN